jgi:hypothetical protein
MTGTSTAGADWKGVGELKTLRRIVGGSAEEDDDAAAPVGHNGPPQGAVYETTGPEIALEEQAQVVERVLGKSEETRASVGEELVKLREKFWHRLV